MSNGARTLPESIYQITPGTQLLMTITGLDERLKTTFIGLERGRYFLFKTPRSASGANLYDYLYPGNTTTIRFLHDGNIWGFTTPIQSYMSKPHPMVFAGFPTKIDSLNLRKEHRIECYFPVSAQINNTGYKGVIVDISCAGCQLHYDPAASDEKLAVGDVFQVQIPVFGAMADKSLTCQVRCIRETSANTKAVGAAFREVDPGVAKSIKDYITQVTGILRA